MFSRAGAALLFSTGEEKAGEMIATGMLDFEVPAPDGVWLWLLADVGLKVVLKETELVLEDTPTPQVLPPVDLEVVELNTVAGRVENFGAPLNVEVELSSGGPAVTGSSTCEAASSKSPSSDSSSGKSFSWTGCWLGSSTAN